ncbi:MAG: hypothetical protein Q8M19_03540 [Reyranella sp.]|nr:hypothetical protein [Reyranella sp.]
MGGLLIWSSLHFRTSASAAPRFDGAGANPRYANKRAEIWGSVKDWLEHASLPDDPELGADLTGVEYGFNAKGEIQLEKKDDMKKRGLASPDIADALALTFALPVSAGWDTSPVQAYCVTKYDLYRDFTPEYWDERTSSTSNWERATPVAFMLFRTASQRLAAPKTMTRKEEHD